MVKYYYVGFFLLWLGIISGNIYLINNLQLFQPEKTTSFPVLTAVSAFSSAQPQNFTNQLQHVRQVLIKTDPTTQKYPQTWAMLTRYVASQDRLPQITSNNSQNLVPQQSVQTVQNLNQLLKAAAEESAIQYSTTQTVRFNLQAWIMLGVINALSLLCTFLLIQDITCLKYLSSNFFNQKNQQLNQGLLFQIKNLISMYQKLEENLQISNIATLEQVLETRKYKRQFVSPPDLSPNPPNGNGNKKNTKNNSQLSVDSIAAALLSDLPDETSFVFEMLTNDSQKSLVPVRINSLEKLKTQNSAHIVVIKIANQSMLESQYQNPSKIIHHWIRHMAQILLNHKVEPLEIAVESNSIFWKLPVGANVSEGEVLKYVKNWYNDSDFIFENEYLALPEISISFLNQFTPGKATNKAINVG